MRRIKVRYATGSAFKRQEIELILDHLEVATPDGRPVCAADAFDVEFPNVDTDEPLERDLIHMVRHKVRSAYRGIMAPCIAEHAGLILETLEDKSYPGGLTQPMWDALGAEGFVNSMRWAGERAIARAVVGYCDGLRVYTFVGETKGTLAPLPLGSRDFYWDTVFCPDGGGGLTYAQISEGANGLAEKVGLSQSTKAMSKLLNHLRCKSASLFPTMP